MPKLLDVVIGLTVVMLVVSLAVTLLTQFLTTLANTQGRMLKSGLANLIAQIDSRFANASAGPKKGNLADEIANAVLTHPMVGERFLGSQRPGSVVHRSELTRLLIEFAIEPAIPSSQQDPPPKLPPSATALKTTTCTVLRQVLSDHGIPNPAATLNEIRMAELALERSHPELANGLRYDLAILQKAETQFVAKINAWFDQTIDRVSSVFTAHARIITFTCAAAVAVALQLDTVAIVNGLWTNDEVRKEIVDEGISFAKAHPPPVSSTIPSGQVSNPAIARNAVDTSSHSLTEPQTDQLAHDQAVRYLDVLSQYGMVAFPALNNHQWWDHWSASEVPGIVLSALLLSMGAPFWYGTLQTLLRLRSQIAQSDDQQRDFRKNNEQVGAASTSQARAPS